MILYILYKTDYGCSTVLHLHLLRVEEQEETCKYKHTTEFPHALAHAQNTLLRVRQRIYKKWAKFNYFKP